MKIQAARSGYLLDCGVRRRSGFAAVCRHASKRGGDQGWHSSCCRPPILQHRCEGGPCLHACMHERAPTKRFPFQNKRLGPLARSAEVHEPAAETAQGNGVNAGPWKRSRLLGTSVHEVPMFPRFQARAHCNATANSGKVLAHIAVTPHCGRCGRTEWTRPRAASGARPRTRKMC